jgi:hypothetical protein
MPLCPGSAAFRTPWKLPAAFAVRAAASTGRTRSKIVLMREWGRFSACILLAAAVLAPDVAVPAEAGQAPAPNPVRPCECPARGDPGTPAGVVWQGPPAGMGLRELAQLLAPILWFSSDEPLLVLRQDLAIPQAHPCDRSSTAAVVYYQATDIVLRGSERVQERPEEDPRFLQKVDHFVLRYFFYYEEDWGLGPHAHDLEVVNLYVYLDRMDLECYRVRIPRIEGLAHGLDWYSNILRVQRDTALPFTILVEEGKHANCPDRNADGVYTPGYDVNVRVNDAWGLRDVVGSSVLLGSRYSASMSKPREPRFRLFPPVSAIPMCTDNGHRLLGAGVESLGRYEIRPAASVPSCQPAGPEPERLLSMMRSHRFGAAWPARQYDSDLEKELSDPENVTRWISAINARVESKRAGVIVQGPGFDMREAWLVPRAHVGRGWFVDALVTPSASRWADWYAAAGFEQLRRNDTQSGDRETIRGFASEVGVKFRVILPGRARWAVMGYRFGGVRIGVRAHGFSRLQHPRLVLEIGAGAF